MLCVSIYICWCPLRFAHEMMFVSFISKTTGAASGAITAYPFRNTCIHTCFSEVRVAQFLVFSVVLCRSLSILLTFVFWSLYCLYGFWLPFSIFKIVVIPPLFIEVHVPSHVSDRSYIFIFPRFSFWIYKQLWLWYFVLFILFSLNKALLIDISSIATFILVCDQYVINITYLALFQSKSFWYFIVSITSYIFRKSLHLNWIVPVKDTLQDFPISNIFICFKHIPINKINCFPFEFNKWWIIKTWYLI